MKFITLAILLCNLCFAQTTLPLALSTENLDYIKKISHQYCDQNEIIKEIDYIGGLIKINKFRFQMANAKYNDTHEQKILKYNAVTEKYELRLDASNF